MKKVAFVTYEASPAITSSDAQVIPLLAPHDIEIEAAVWSDPAVNWASYDAIILRSTWDYHERYKEFLAWIDRLERAGLPLWNSPAVVRRNSDKIYLQELAAKGFTTVPTVFPSAITIDEILPLILQHHWEKGIVKARIGASGGQVWKFPTVYRESLQAAIEGAGIMVQRFIGEVTEKGEWSFLFFRGKGHIQYSHAVLKRAANGGFMTNSEHQGYIDTLAAPPSLSLVAQAMRVVEAVEGDWLYARVDGIELDGVLVLMELELIEPSLFLMESNPGATYFAQAIRSVLA